MPWPRLSWASVVPSVGSRGDSYDNALAESLGGLYKAEVIHHGGPWRGLDDVEYATLATESRSGPVWTVSRPADPFARALREMGRQHAPQCNMTHATCNVPNDMKAQ